MRLRKTHFSPKVRRLDINYEVKYYNILKKGRYEGVVEIVHGIAFVNTEMKRKKIFIS